jgi:regulator of sigma E protease
MDWFGWLGAVFAISLLIIVHEAGHYFVAKWCKMRVDRFSLGFGPALVSWRRKETLFQIAPIPFGGFVEIRGMNIADDVDALDPQAYPNRPAWQRFAAIFAGPATNYLFAIVLAFILFSTAGISSGTAWYQVSNVDPGFDAHGKLEPGDRILSVQGPGDQAPVPVYHLYEGAPPAQPLAEIVHTSSGDALTVTVVRDGQERTVQVAAKQDPELVWNEDTGEKQYRLGIGLEYQDERVHVGVLGAAGYALYFPIKQTSFILNSLYKIIVGEEKGELTGPVGIADAIKQAIEAGWIVALWLLMVLNVWLGLVNLLPLPALDGGRLVFLVYEMATRRRANPKIEATVHMAGILVLLLVMVAVTYKDCARVL